MAEVEKIALNKKPSARVAMNATWFGLALAIVGGFAEFAEGLRAPFFMAAGGAFGIALVSGLLHWQMKKRQGTGLRLDPAGLSGYVLPLPLRWDEIDSFGLIRLANEGRAVGVSMRDPEQLGAYRQVMLQPDDNAEPWKYHLALRCTQLDLDPRDLLEKLRDWHDRHG